MASKKKLLQAAAGSAGGAAALDVDDVFSTYLYTGNSAAQKIENGIQLGAASTDNVALHMTGATSTDNGPLSLTVNSIGNATTSTTQTKFTSKSLYVDGTGSGDSTTCFDVQEGQIKLAKKDFTIEYWVYYNSHNSYGDLGSWNYYVSGYNGNFRMGIGGTGTNINIFAYDGQTFVGSVSGTVSVSTGTWYHVAISRSNGTAYLFLDGTLVTSGAFDHDLKDAEIGGITLGKISAYEQVDAYFSDFRITVGAARYTSSFTAPSAALPVDSGTSGEGGLVWTKERTGNGVGYHGFFDTERGAGKVIYSNVTNAEGSTSALTSLNSNGFTLGDNGVTNGNNSEYTSWTFRKAPKFFDIQTWTGDGASDRAISHNLDSVPGMIIVKRLNSSEDWGVWHREVHENTTKVLYLNQTGAAVVSTHIFGATNPTSTAFHVGNHPVSNNSGDSYVAYLFAHNDGDGEFGPDGDQDIIKCGSYTGNGSSTGPVIDLGFEPQFIMLKKTNSSQNANWYVFDTMRGIVTGGDDPYLYANNTNAEVAGNVLEVTPTGFQLKTSGNGFNGSSDTYIYMAIRRGPLAAPENATDVFAIASATGASGGLPKFRTTFRVDATLDRADRDIAGYFRSSSRLTQGKRLTPTANDAESSPGSYVFDYMTGWNSDSGGDGNHFAWMWQRAPSFCDVVAYTGTGSARTIPHNLGVAPEMMWIKNRDVATSWMVYHSALGNQAYLQLNTDGAAVTGNTSRWNATTPTASVFSLGDSGSVNGTSNKIIAYLFASLDGVSKVGSYTGNGSTQNIDCGFSSGARFVLIKRTDVAEGWKVHDSVRGIVAGNDPFLEINSTNQENTSFDLIDPLSSGFTVNNYAGWNASGGSYIFYAIA